MGHPSARPSPPLLRGPRVDEAELRDAPRLLARMRAQLAAPDYKPPMLPATALQVHALSRRPEVTVQKLLEVLERDPMLAADVLRRASAADVAGRNRPKSLRDATLRLGTRGLGAFVLEVALTGRVFRVPGLEVPMRELQEHSALVAACARAVAIHAEVDDPDAAELAGLLHDVGIAAGLHLMGSVAAGRAAPIEMLAEMARGYGAEAGRIVAATWALPAEIASAVAHHDDPVFVQTRPDGAQVESWDVVAACITLANAIALALVQSPSPFARALGAVSERGTADALHVLGLTPDDVDVVREQMAGTRPVG